MNTLKRLTRQRMAETGEKYLAARRVVMRMMAESRARQDYPFTDHDGLGRRHVLSAFETQRRAH